MICIGRACRWQEEKRPFSYFFSFFRQKAAFFCSGTAASARNGGKALRSPAVERAGSLPASHGAFFRGLCGKNGPGKRETPLPGGALGKRITGKGTGPQRRHGRKYGASRRRGAYVLRRGLLQALSSAAYRIAAREGAAAVCGERLFPLENGFSTAAAKAWAGHSRAGRMTRPGLRARGGFRLMPDKEEAFLLRPFLFACLAAQKAWKGRPPHSGARRSSRGERMEKSVFGNVRGGGFGAFRRCLRGVYSLPCEKRVIISMVREAESGQGGIWERSTHTASASSAVSRRMSSGPSSSAT